MPPTQPLNSNPPRDGGEAVPTPKPLPPQSPSQSPESILLPVSKPWTESTSDALVWVLGVDVFIFPLLLNPGLAASHCVSLHFSGCLALRWESSVAPAQFPLP